MDHLEFFDKVAAARTPSNVTDLLATHARDLGQASFAIGGTAGSALEDLTTFFFTNWTDACLEEYDARGLVHHDPVPQMVATQIRPATWAEVWGGSAGVAIDEGHRTVKDAVADHGYKGGLVVPIHGPRGYAAVASFVGEQDPETERDKALLHMLGLYAHHRLLELHGDAGGPTGADIRLTVRERDALNYLVAGESDEGIARKMGVSERTVRFHVDNVRRKLEARTRAQAVARAIFLRLLDP